MEESLGVPAVDGVGEPSARLHSDLLPAIIASLINSRGSRAVGTVVVLVLASRKLFLTVRTRTLRTPPEQSAPVERAFQQIPIVP